MVASEVVFAAPYDDSDPDEITEMTFDSIEAICSRIEREISNARRSSERRRKNCRVFYLCFFSLLVAWAIVHP